MNKRELGTMGEQIALHHLAQKGYISLDINYHQRCGEIDLICLDPDLELTFVEVKTRTSGRFGDPATALTPAKIQRLIKTAHNYLWFYPEYNERWRIDLITVKLTQHQTQIQHFKNILND